MRDEGKDEPENETDDGKDEVEGVETIPSVTGFLFHDGGLRERTEILIRFWHDRNKLEWL